MCMYPRSTYASHPLGHHVPKNNPLQIMLFAPILKFDRLEHTHDLEWCERINSSRMRYFRTRDQIIETLHVEARDLHAERWAEDGDHRKGKTGIHGCWRSLVVAGEGVCFAIVQDHKVPILVAADAIGAV